MHGIPTRSGKSSGGVTRRASAAIHARDSNAHSAEGADGTTGVITVAGIAGAIAIAVGEGSNDAAGTDPNVATADTRRNGVHN